MNKPIKPFRGFSIAEILLCLVLAGVLGAMTIPPLLTGSMNNKSTQYTVSTRNVALMLTTALERYKANSATLSNLKLGGILNYGNYVALDKSSIIDGSSGSTSNCSQFPSQICYKLHNGGVLRDTMYPCFNVNNKDNYALAIDFDPSGAADNVPAIQLLIYADGKIATAGTMRSPTRYWPFSSDTYPSASDPAWFQGF